MSYSNLTPVKKTILIASTALSPSSPHPFALLRFRVTYDHWRIDFVSKYSFYIISICHSQISPLLKRQSSSPRPPYLLPLLTFSHSCDSELPYDPWRIDFNREMPAWRTTGLASNR